MINAYLIHLSDNMWCQPCLHFSGDTEPERKLHVDDVVWRAVIDFLPSQGYDTVVIDLGDGILYDSHPEISVAGAWSKDKLKAELDYILSRGMQVIPKLNFSAVLGFGRIIAAGIRRILLRICRNVQFSLTGFMDDSGKIPTARTMKMM